MSCVTKRNSVVDIMKGIAIILVVMGHTYTKYIYNFISLFHVTIFFIISGYCFNNAYLETRKSFFELLRKRLLSLWLPYVAYNFIALLFQNFFLKIGFLTSDKLAYEKLGAALLDGYCLPISLKESLVCIFKSFIFMNSRPFVGGLWFLGGLFFVTFLYCFIQFILQKIHLEKYHIVISFFLLCLGFLFEKLDFDSKMSLIKQLDIILICEIMFVLGVIIRTKKVMDRLANLSFSIKIFIVGICFSLLVICSLNNSISIAGRVIVNPIFYLMVSLLGFILVYTVSHFINNSYFKRIFIFLGQHTIPILALHTLAFKIITYMQVNIYGNDMIALSSYPVLENTLIWSVLYVLAGVLVPLIVILPLQRFKIVKKIFAL